MQESIRPLSKSLGEKLAIEYIKIYLNTLYGGSMLKTIAVIFGVIMLLVGILGFVPQATPNGLLLGIFAVNSMHNIVHILTGLVSICCGFQSIQLSRIFFQVFGLVYAVVAFLGFFYMDHPILGILANNLADAFLHVAIAAFSIYLGFFYTTDVKAPY